MRKVIATLILGATLGFAGSAGASWHRSAPQRLTRLVPCHARSLTVARASCAIADYGLSDNPSSVAVSACHRISSTRVRCSLVERGEAVLLTNGHRVLADVLWRCEVDWMRQRHLVYVHVVGTGEYPFYEAL